MDKKIVRMTELSMRMNRLSRNASQNNNIIRKVERQMRKLSAK